MLQQEFEEIQAWNGTNDTGEQARNKIKRNFSRVNAAIEGLEQLIAKSVSGVKKGMTIEWDINLPIPSGFVPANGNGGVPINGVVIPDKRGRVTVGYDPATAQTPGIATSLLKNYGKVGNIGGITGVKLTGKQSGLQDHDHDVLVYKGKYDGTGSQDGVKPTGTLKFKSAKSGYKDAEEAFDNRMEYTVGFFITKVSDDVDGEGSVGIQTIVAGSNINVDKTDPYNPVLSVTGLSNYVPIVPGKSLISDSEIARLAGVYNVDISGKENVGVAAQLISDLKSGVPSAGDTLLKLFNEIGLKINRTETLTATEIQLLISNLVDSAPATLNTFNELSAALANDPNFATTITTLIGTKLNATKAAIEALLTGLITSHYHNAGDTHFTSYGSITATNVQVAVQQLENKVSSITQPYEELFLTTITESQGFLIPSDLWIKEVNLFVLSGNPTLEIPSLNSGELTGYDMYPVLGPKQYSQYSELSINMTGTGSVRIQIIIYKIDKPNI